MPKLNLTWHQLEVIGVVFCRCGHPPNNHFRRDRKKPCALCRCQHLERELVLPTRSPPKEVSGG